MGYGWAGRGIGSEGLRMRSEALVGVCLAFAFLRGISYMIIASPFMVTLLNSFFPYEIISYHIILYSVK